MPTARAYRSRVSNVGVERMLFSNRLRFGLAIPVSLVQDQKGSNPDLAPSLQRVNHASTPFMATEYLVGLTREWLRSPRRDLTSQGFQNLDSLGTKFHF